MAQLLTQDYWLVMDFEATCEDNRRDWPNEIIEFPGIMIRACDGKTLGEFESFVRPIENPTLTKFCTDLTSIQQSDVEGAPTLPEVLKAFNEWVQSFIQEDENPTVLPIFCGDWDLNTCLPKECIRKQLYGVVPDFLASWCNLKVPFESTMNVKSHGMANMLKVLGIGLVGTHHRGIDDSRNLARILAALVGHGGKRFVKRTRSLKCDEQMKLMFMNGSTQAHSERQLTVQPTEVINQAIVKNGAGAGAGAGASGGDGNGDTKREDKFSELPKKSLNKSNSSKAERRAHQEEQRAKKMMGTSVNMTQDKYFSAVCRPLSIKELRRAQKNDLDASHDRSVGLICLCTSPLEGSVEGEPSVLVILPKRHKKLEGDLEVNDWVFPKGHPMEGESDIDAAIRETIEEAGVKASQVFEHITSSSGYSYIGHLHSDKWKLHPDYPDESKRPLMVIHKTVQYFLAVVNDGVEAQSSVASEGTSESSSAAWMPLFKAERCLKHKEDKSMLFQFSQRLQQKTKSENEV